jgi:hypothetical protein
MSAPRALVRQVKADAEVPRAIQGDPNMRFMFIIKSDQAAAPTAEMIEAMHALAQREVKAGRMIDDGGLMPRDAGAEVRLAGGKLIVMDGPFTETKEMIGGYAIFELPDRDAAIASALEFLKLHQKFMPEWEGVCEVREVAGSQVAMLRGGG